MKLKVIYKHLFRRRLPFGLFSWRFILPKQSAATRFHRRLVMLHFPRIPRPIVLLVVLFTGFRWSFFYSPYYTFRVVKKRGKINQKKTGLTPWQQYWQVLSVSMGHGLLPSHWYLYRMYLVDNRKKLWNNIYEQEVAAFHYYRNHQHPKYKEHSALLSDKWHFEQYLQECRIATAGTLMLISRGSRDFRRHLEKLVQRHGQIFCKRRTGNQGKGAFSAFLIDTHLHIQPRGETQLSKASIDIFLQKNIAKHDYLLQPDYKHHKSFQVANNQSRPAVTIRIISQFDNNKVNLESSVLYWPFIYKQQTLFYYPIAIVPECGTINNTSSWPQDNLEEKQLKNLEHFIKELSDTSLPFWSEAVELVYKAHTLLFGIDQIAWDLILAEDRVVLLEGNSGWGGLAVCQWAGYDMQQNFV